MEDYVVEYTKHEAIVIHTHECLAYYRLTVDLGATVKFASHSSEKFFTLHSANDLTHQLAEIP